MQFIKCRFRSSDTRAYTYSNPGEPVAVGDFVKAPDKSGDGWKRVEVTEIDVPKPTQFECKAILGKIEDEPKADEGEQAAA